MKNSFFIPSPKNYRSFCFFHNKSVSLCSLFVSFIHKQLVQLDLQCWTFNANLLEHLISNRCLRGNFYSFMLIFKMLTNSMTFVPQVLYRCKQCQRGLHERQCVSTSNWIRFPSSYWFTLHMWKLDVERLFFSSVRIS